MRTIAIEYLDLSFLPGTSASAEHLFSAAKFLLADIRCHMQPLLVKVIMQLRANRNYWDKFSIHQVLNISVENDNIQDMDSVKRLQCELEAFVMDVVDPTEYGGW